MNKYNRFIIQFIFIICVFTTITGQEPTLKSINVIFRHGERTPDRLYPNDLTKVSSFYPLDFGDLNNVGKRHEYRLGYSLRQRYNDFLGMYYIPSDVFGRSTTPGRTRMSLELVLAALYPPRKQEIWNENLNWQPTSSYGYLPENLDPILNYIWTCKAYVTEIRRIQTTPQFKDKLSKFDGLMKNLTYLMGEPIQNLVDLYNIYFTFETELQMNLTQPDWTASYYPYIIEAALLQYELQSYNTKLKRLNGGALMHVILQIILSPNATKVNLFCGHDSNVAGMLLFLNVWDKTAPDFSSGLILEHYEDNGQVYFKVVYYRGVPAVFEDRTIPGCELLCPLEDFLRILKGLIPDDPIEECFGPPSDSELIPKGEDPVEWIYDQMREWFIPPNKNNN